MIEQNIKEKIKEVYKVLPKLNDRRCGYRTCGEFARAVVKEETPCYGCVSGGYAVAKKICNIMGEKVSVGKKIPSKYYSRTGDFTGSISGRGRGYRNRYYATGLPANGRYKSVSSAQIGLSAGYNYRSNMQQNQRMDAGQEIAVLAQQADSIRKQLDDIEERISKLEKG